MDFIVTDNIRTNKNQHNDAIENDLKFNHTFSLSSGAKEPLPVVIIGLLGDKKHIATMVAGITCLWDIRYTDSMNKIKQTKYYEHRMWSNKVEYITAAYLYCTTNDVKVPFCMP